MSYHFKERRDILNLFLRKQNQNITYNKASYGIQLVEALRYKPEGAGSILDGVIGIFH
jgi:hypothetical protein